MVLCWDVTSGVHWWLVPLAAQRGKWSPECLVLALPAIVIAFLLSWELERLEGGTLGTSPSPSVTHRKLSISQPVAQGLKAVKFPVSLCGERQPGFRWVSQHPVPADYHRHASHCYSLKGQCLAGSGRGYIPGSVGCPWP